MVKLFDSLEEVTKIVSLGKSVLLIAPNDDEICLSHTKNGFFAIQNKCSHAGANLYEGFINEQNEVVCPLHHYCFELKTGKTTRGNSLPLKTYRLEWKLDAKTNKDALFIDL